MASLVDEDGVQVESQAWDRIPPEAFKLVRRTVFAHLVKIGWTQGEIAATFCCSQMTVSRTLSGESS